MMTGKLIKNLVRSFETWGSKVVVIRGHSYMSSTQRGQTKEGVNTNNGLDTFQGTTEVTRGGCKKLET